MSSRCEQVAEEHRDDLLALANVVGTAGGDTDVLVLVERKLPIEELEPEDLVPEELDGVETDVIEVGHLRPMRQVGASIGLPDAGTGTFGCVVRDIPGLPHEVDRHYILTNNHVAADSNRAAVLSPIHHPGAADGLGKQIGRLARFEPIYFDRPNLVDAALVEVDPKAVQEAIGHFPGPTRTAFVGWEVQKRGRTTGHTWGEVVGRNASVKVDFGRQGTALFVGQTLTTAMLEPGDSGSMLATRAGHACALGFAGSDLVSIHTPISVVLRQLAVRIAA